jgi:flagellar biosynthesis GTPase FlhF
MTISGRVLAAAALAATIAGCAARDGPRGQATPRSPAADQAQRAEERAQQTERELAHSRQRLEGARQEAAKATQQHAQARQQLAQAEHRAAQSQQRVAQEQASIQRLEVAAREHRTQAIQAAVQAHIADEEARGLQAAEGRLTEASPTRVVLQMDDGRSMSFQVDPRTRVLVGVQERSVAELQHGADARVAYDPRAADRAAVSILVTPARGVPPPASSPPQGQPRQ